jgi:hypothetical protein
MPSSDLLIRGKEVEPSVHAGALSLAPVVRADEFGDHTSIELVLQLSPQDQSSRVISAIRVVALWHPEAEVGVSASDLGAPVGP